MNDTKTVDRGVALMTRKDGEGTTFDLGIALKTSKNGERAAVETRDRHVVERVKTDDAQEHQPSDAEPDHPAKPRRRPWVWALLGAAAVVGIGVGVAYYLYSLS
jgi:hypothetical protein